MKDFGFAKEEGEKQATKLSDGRVLTNEKQIYDQINLNKRSDFSQPTVDKNTGKVRKTDPMELYRAIVKIISLAETPAVDLEELMGYSLTEIYLPLLNINGQMRKAVKSTLINSFEMHETALEGVPCISIVDMGFIWRLATPSNADHEIAEDDFTLGNYATKIFNIILQRHPNAIEYNLVNTMLNCPLKMLNIKKETPCFLKEAEIFSLQVILQSRQQETLTASLEMQRTR